MKNVLVITDPGLDPDDIVNAWLLATAHKRGEINLLGAIANYSPSIMRARLLKGVFDNLNVNVPVKMGTDCNSNHEPREYEFNFPLAQTSEVFDYEYVRGYEHWIANSFLKGVLECSEDKSVTLQLISGLTDIAQAITYYPDILKRKLKEVYIMGGATFKEGRLIIDPTASNNKLIRHLIPR
jgi:inosine-uridine nucleoside N-ribohydrolase